MSGRRIVGGIKDKVKDKKDKDKDKDNDKKKNKTDKREKKVRQKSRTRTVHSGNARKIAQQRYLIRSKIVEQRKARRLAREQAVNRTNNKYVVSRKDAILEKRKRRLSKAERLNAKKAGKSKSISEKQSKNDKPALQMYSGTIIYGGKIGLHPYKWNPEDDGNSPSHYRWETLLPGTHVLDQSTFLTWIVTKSRSLQLAPCQTIRLDLSVPETLSEFNPGLSLNPYLPETSQIPIGTKFIFRDSNVVYRLNDNILLEAIPNASSSRPSQIIPVPINSLYNTQQLFGLNTPIVNSQLQRPTSDKGYETLSDWFDGFLKGTDTRPGFLGDLPKLDLLQPYDVIDFYDPNMKNNPKLNGMNPDGTVYIDGLHESKYFKFKLQIVLDEKDKLTARQITEPKSPLICNISIPTETTNQDRPIYIRSAALIPYVGDPMPVFNQLENPYYFDNEVDIDRVLEDFTKGLTSLGYPYGKIKCTYEGQIAGFYIIRFNNIPKHIWGIVFSSDGMPMNKYSGSGRFFMGYSANCQGSTYSCIIDGDDSEDYNEKENSDNERDDNERDDNERDDNERDDNERDDNDGSGIVIEKLEVEDITIDGMLIKLSNIGDRSGVIKMNSNRQVGEMLNLVNVEMNSIGYPGYVLNIWWNESNKSLKFYLSGVVNTNLPDIMMNLNGNLVPLIFDNR